MTMLFSSNPAILVHTYTAPPAGEIGFRRAVGESYHREIWRLPSGHYLSTHDMKVATDYTGDYVSATYGDEAGMARAFRRIMSLLPEKSDNVGRVKRIREFAGAPRARRMLDVGSGLGVFPCAASAHGWKCTALDPDPRAVAWVGTFHIKAVCGDFMTVADLGRFDAITMNKVLEHVTDPVAMLSRARDMLTPEGFVYIELPDGEMAAKDPDGFNREEFFIEHHHIFSFASTAMLATRAGFDPVVIERLREPSGKYTLRAFLR